MVGDYWYCTVTPDDGYHNGTTILSNTVYIYKIDKPVKIQLLQFYTNPFLVY